MSISIIVPVYNEEDSLRPLYEEVTAAMQHVTISRYELILVDDGSRDASVQVMTELFERDPDHVRCIMLRRNFGQTAAMAAGFDAATGELIIPMDADLQNDPADIPRLMEKIHEGYDVVSGWRKNRQDKALSRKLPSKMANWLISKITGVNLHDYGCTLKVYHRDVTQHMRLYGELHRFLPALAHWSGARVAEMPVNHRARQFGQSKYGIGRTLRVILDLITVKFLLSYSTKPMQVFGKWGFISMFVGLLCMAWTVGLKLFTAHHNITGNPYIYMAIFFLLGGLQLICMGLLGELNVRTYYESQQKPIYTIREQLRKD
ncbi:MAG: glycosyltransferase family 2 protein [Candidatus Hydrogenedentes bacterium]|nr:glycosyltransferase family 2 protein [Candidatus Hydrogenedentota bacterium]